MSYEGHQLLLLRLDAQDACVGPQKDTSFMTRMYHTNFGSTTSFMMFLFLVFIFILSELIGIEKLYNKV